MFGWLKRRLKKEHRKLAFQTYKAATDPEMPFLCLTKGGMDFRHSFDNAEIFAVKLIADLVNDSKPTTKTIGAVLAANKDMRRIYDEFGRKGRGGFDEVYQPLGGWSDYFDRSSDELHLIENQREIRDLVA